MKKKSCLFLLPSGRRPGVTTCIPLSHGRRRRRRLTATSAPFRTITAQHRRHPKFPRKPVSNQEISAELSFFVPIFEKRFRKIQATIKRRTLLDPGFYPRFRLPARISGGIIMSSANSTCPSLSARSNLVLLFMVACLVEGYKIFIFDITGIDEATRHDN